jgi:hypothetical protein
MKVSFFIIYLGDSKIYSQNTHLNTNKSLQIGGHTYRELVLFKDTNNIITNNNDIHISMQGLKKDMRSWSLL